MTEGLPDSVDGFLDRVDTSEKTLLVVNRTRAEEILNLLERGIDEQAVSIVDRHFPDGTEDLVCLVDDGELTATSSLESLEKAYLLVNADRYRTGTRQIETGSFPDVLTGLDGIEFTVRGYPESIKEKLLLILISRFIEFRALQEGTGTLRTTFQYLSRLDDEYGTRRVYEWLADTDVTTHVYGVDDDPSAVEDLGVTVHAGDHEEYHRPWVVVFTPDQSDNGSSTSHAALVAVETRPNLWRGVWTYDPALVEDVEAYVRLRF